MPNLSGETQSHELISILNMEGVAIQTTLSSGLYLTRVVCPKTGTIKSVGSARNLHESIKRALK